MSLEITHLNADATFLLTFRPAFDFPPSPGRAPGSFSIVLDPWLSGPSTVFSSKFSVQTHTTPSSIDTLNDIPEPDVIIISQDKADHCHEQTLCELQPDQIKTIFLAAPAAAKRMKSWKYFDPDQVQAFERWDPKNPRAVRRFPIPAFSPNGSLGEVTISFLADALDLMGMHNGVAITYRAPQTPAMNFSHPRPSIHQHPSSRSSNSSSSTTGSRGKAMSIIFSPHGVDYPVIKPFAASHLVAESALPLTALLHGFDRVDNPWYLGGNISTGVPGGIQIAQSLQTRYWISAHDEDKDVGGVTASSIRKKKYTGEEVATLLQTGKGKATTDVVVLDVGETMVLP
jgi:hypothetical protein